MKKRQKVALVIMDGIGHSNSKQGNATYHNMPFLDSLKKTSSFTLLSASGKSVGLPKGFMGNSEVGHLNIGAGRDFKQTIERINDSIKDKSFFKNEELIKIITKTEKSNSSIHLIGMYSEAGIHSHINHLKALINVVKKSNVNRCYLHVISDGRDTKPKEIKKYVDKIKKYIGDQFGTNKKFVFASLSGRYYSMDRDNRWDRTEEYYNVLFGNGSKISTINQAINLAYKNKQTDEFIKPVRLNNYSGIKSNDSLIFFNFREDRMRQIVSSFYTKKNGFFSREKYSHDKLNLLCMYEYDSHFKIPVMFSKEKLKNTLGEIISNNSLQQLRLAETEKAAHVTYFFNGGNEKKFKGEKRVIISSPNVKTYDLKPEMSAIKITESFVEKANKFDFIVVNFANGDMVGHTGDFLATKKAIRVVDNCLRDITNYCKENKIQLVITADHGNCEEMISKWKKTHTLNKIPFFIVDKKIKLCAGSLKNVAPTILKIMKIKKPKEMDAISLI